MLKGDDADPKPSDLLTGLPAAGLRYESRKGVYLTADQACHPSAACAYHFIALPIRLYACRACAWISKPRRRNLRRGGLIRTTLETACYVVTAASPGCHPSPLGCPRWSLLLLPMSSMIWVLLQLCSTPFAPYTFLRDSAALLCNCSALMAPYSQLACFRVNSLRAPLTGPFVGDSLLMRLLLCVWLYGGPDQLMPLTSGLATVFAFFLIFWNKILWFCTRIWKYFRHTRLPKDPGFPSDQN